MSSTVALCLIQPVTDGGVLTACALSTPVSSIMTAAAAATSCRRHLESQVGGFIVAFPSSPEVCACWAD